MTEFHHIDQYHLLPHPLITELRRTSDHKSVTVLAFHRSGHLEGTHVNEFEVRTETGLVDLTEVPLDALSAIDRSALAPSVAKLLSQIDRAGSTVGGHNS